MTAKVVRWSSAIQFHNKFYGKIYWKFVINYIRFALHTLDNSISLIPGFGEIKIKCFFVKGIG